MKLFDYEKYEDYGWEFFFQVLKFPKFALLDITVQWDDFGSDSILPEFSLYHPKTIEKQEKQNNYYNTL